ncbi:hypothetical protein RND71_031713 [Anisodus tanguticus]|uniref:Transmembrane protein 135 n=1 Tax=Anisodus tanguticus TaxID=243964 RepID=A0AAE1RCB3_9SOLA|nr:hypothetical protein RND71_031713 [Anisodus tanguticus]
MPPSGDGADTSTGGRCTCSSTDENQIDNCQHCRRSTLPSSSSSCSLLSLESYQVQDYDKLWRIYSASIKGFTIGAGLKGGLAIFALLSRLRRRKSSKKAQMVSSSEDVVFALKETLRYGLFLGTFAGPSMLLIGNTQHTSLAIYILMCATVLASRCGIKSKRFGHICKPLTWAHGDIFLMCLSSSQILSTYILKQDSLHPSYKSFLNKHGGKAQVILQGVRDLACGNSLVNLDAIENHYKSSGVDIKLDPQMKVPCSIIHENQGCGEHFISFLIQAYKRALPVYLPVYLVPALIVHRQGLLKRPNTILAKGLLGTTRSSLFLSVYCSSAWLWTCLLFRLFKRCNIPMVALGTFPTGLALAIEKKSRRIEISLYCLARALESFFTCMADVGYLPRSEKLKRADVVSRLAPDYFTGITQTSWRISSCLRGIEPTLSHARAPYSAQALPLDYAPEDKYLNVLDWVFGVPLPPYETTRKKR